MSGKGEKRLGTEPTFVLGDPGSRAWARTGGAEDAQRLPGEERIGHAGYRTGQDHLRGAQLVVRVLGEERAERDGWGEAREEEKGDGR